MSNKKEQIRVLATKLVAFGYTVYLSKSGEYGFYTDGVRVVCFQINYGALSFSGNYTPKANCGNGWRIEKMLTNISEAGAQAFIKANAPGWTGNRSPIYTTPEQHLKRYGVSSGYTKFGGEL